MPSTLRIERIASSRLATRRIGKTGFKVCLLEDFLLTDDSGEIPSRTLAAYRGPMAKVRTLLRAKGSPAAIADVEEIDGMTVITAIRAANDDAAPKRRGSPPTVAKASVPHAGRSGVYVIETDLADADFATALDRHGRPYVVIRRPGQRTLMAFNGAVDMLDAAEGHFFCAVNSHADGAMRINLIGTEAECIAHVERSIARRAAARTAIRVVENHA